MKLAKNICLYFSSWKLFLKTSSHSLTGCAERVADSFTGSTFRKLDFTLPRISIVILFKKPYILLVLEEKSMGIFVFEINILSSKNGALLYNQNLNLKDLS